MKPQSTPARARRAARGEYLWANVQEKPLFGTLKEFSLGFAERAILCGGDAASIIIAVP